MPTTVKNSCAARRYGVYGLTEWEALLPVGKAAVRIHFKGGSLSALGVVPATFSTACPALQELIQKSEHFRSGRIVVIR